MAKDIRHSRNRGRRRDSVLERIVDHGERRVDHKGEWSLHEECHRKEKVELLVHEQGGTRCAAMGGRRPSNKEIDRAKGIVSQRDSSHGKERVELFVREQGGPSVRSSEGGGRRPQQKGTEVQPTSALLLAG